METAELLEIIARGEDSKHQFKVDVTNAQSLASEIVAFANSGGGHLVIGVQDDGTIDGVPRMYKGTATTRDWLEQVVPDLVSYPLQDFRVHEVEPDESSLIPSDHVVIVIDIGDSMQAPHQSAITKIYHHRSGGRSLPAPHHFLEMLRGREAYPSQRIAYSWLNFVIAPWLRVLDREREALTNQTIEWDRFSKTLRWLTKLSPSSAVEIQFLRSYEAIQESIASHDLGLVSLRGEVERLFEYIKRDSLLADAYDKAISSESIKEMRRRNPYPDSRYGASNPEMLQGLFGTMSKEEQLALLAEYAINRRSDLPATEILNPLWNTHGTSFRNLLNRYPINEGRDIVRKAIETQAQNVAELTTLIEETRHELSFKYGEPYEDLTLMRTADGSRFQ